jgi:hypothetical protein
MGHAHEAAAVIQRGGTSSEGHVLAGDREASAGRPDRPVRRASLTVVANEHDAQLILGDGTVRIRVPLGEIVGGGCSDAPKHVGDASTAIQPEAGHTVGGINGLLGRQRGGFVGVQ